MIFAKRRTRKTLLGFALIYGFIHGYALAITPGTTSMDKLMLNQILPYSTNNPLPWPGLGSTAPIIGGSLSGYINVSQTPYNVVGDAFRCGPTLATVTNFNTVQVSGCATQFTTANSLGKYISIGTAGPGGLAYQGTVASVVNGTTLTVTPATTSNPAGVGIVIGTDNTVSLQAAEADCEISGRPVIFPPGNYITGIVDLGQVSTQATLGSTTGVPNCFNNYGAGRFSTFIWCKPNIGTFDNTSVNAACLQRRNPSDLTIANLTIEGALGDSVINDQAINLLDVSWYPGAAPSTESSIHDIIVRGFSGVGLNLTQETDSGLWDLWAGPFYNSGLSTSITAGGCTETTTSACAAGQTAVCNATAQPFQVGQYVEITGNTIAGYNTVNNGATPIVATTTNTFSTCVTASGLGNGTGGTALNVPISINAVFNGGQGGFHDVVVNAGLIIVSGQNMIFSGTCGIYDGIEILPNDVGFTTFNGCQFLGADPADANTVINIPVIANANGVYTLVFNGDYFNSGNGTQLLQGLIRGGAIWNGGDLVSSVANGITVFGPLSYGGGSTNFPTFTFNTTDIGNTNVNQPAIDADVILNAVQLGGTNTILGTAGLTGTLNRETAFSGTGALALPASTAGMQSSKLWPVTDAAACTNGTAYAAGGGAVKCLIHFNGTSPIETGIAW